MMMDNQDKEQQKEKLEWNLASAFIIEIAEMFRLASVHAIHRSYLNEFLCLMQVRKRVSVNLDTKELEELKQLEQQLLSLSSSWQDVGFNIVTEDRKRKRAMFCIHLSSYNDLLLHLLKIYGLYIPAKKDKTRI